MQRLITIARDGSFSTALARTGAGAGLPGTHPFGGPRKSGRGQIGDALVSAHRPGREEQTERVTRTVRIGANGEVDLRNIAGDIADLPRQRHRCDARGGEARARPDDRRRARGAATGAGGNRGTGRTAGSTHPLPRRDRNAHAQPPQHQRLGLLHGDRAGRHPRHRQLDLREYPRAGHPGRPDPRIDQRQHPDRQQRTRRDRENHLGQRRSRRDRDRWLRSRPRP